MHDFRVVGGTTHSNLVFDVAVPFDCTLSEAEILSKTAYLSSAKTSTPW